MLKIALPLPLNGKGARLLLLKDLSRDPLNYYTLRRLEHLRRTLCHNLSRLQKSGYRSRFLAVSFPFSFFQGKCKIFYLYQHSSK